MIQSILLLFNCLRTRILFATEVAENKTIKIYSASSVSSVRYRTSNGGRGHYSTISYVFKAFYKYLFYDQFAKQQSPRSQYQK